MYRVNVLENVINRRRREQKENRVDVYKKKRDKLALKNLCYTSDGEIVCLTMMFF